MMNGYDDPRWVTMIQIMDRDRKYHPNERWHLRAGSKATYVEYWYPVDPKDNKALTWEQYRTELANGRYESEFRLATKYIPVFNAKEVVGIPERTKETDVDFNIDKLIDKLAENMKVSIYLDGGAVPYYSIKDDSIHLPTLGAFDDEYAFSSAALHELAHSTGHPSRLNRDQRGMTGSEEYAFEELVAEMSACFMGVNLDTGPDARHIENHKAYVQGWIQAIRDKPEVLVRAVKEAQAAANYMDWKAEIISDKEYSELRGKTFEIPKVQTPVKEAGLER